MPRRASPCPSEQNLAPSLTLGSWDEYLAMWWHCPVLCAARGRDCRAVGAKLASPSHSDGCAPGRRVGEGLGAGRGPNTPLRGRGEKAFCLLLCISASCHSVGLLGFLLWTSHRLLLIEPRRAMGSVKPGPGVTWLVGVFFFAVGYCP